jgi:hypothetical protein
MVSKLAQLNAKSDPEVGRVNEPLVSCRQVAKARTVEPLAPVFSPLKHRHWKHWFNELRRF